MDKITLGHGSGGRLMHELINRLFVKKFDNEILSELDDAACIGSHKERLCFTTDSYVVKPLFFPGGDIGKLSVCGTVNDLAMKGAKPLYMTVSFIIEEGFPVDDLSKIVDSMVNTARQAGVKIVSGDTKVVENGSADNLFVTTSGVGILSEGVDISGKNAMEGDAVIISGAIGDHGICILNARENLGLESGLKTDCAPLNSLVEKALSASKKIHAMRDPTRGGLAASLNEIASSSNIEIEIEEEKIPVKKEVKASCDILGIDPIYVPNEGKCVIFCDNGDAEIILRKIKELPEARDAAIIGKVTNKGSGKVLLKTKIGGKKILPMLESDQLPRIC